MSPLDLGVLVTYLIGVVAFGVWVGRRSRTSGAFMAASVPGWAAGLSIFGTFVSSISVLALPGRAYAGDWNPFVFSLTIPLAAWLAVRYFVPFHRQAGTVSSYEHLEGRFGPWARSYAVLCYLLTQLARVGVILYLLALALAPLTGWSLPALILLAGALVIVYTIVGGIAAVIWTDVVQSVVLLGGSALCLIVLVTGLPGGVAELAAQGGAGKFSLGSLGLDFSQSTVWVVLLYGIAINLQNFGIDQSYVQRYHAARTMAAARRSVWLGGLLYLPASAVFLLIGTALFAYYGTYPDRLAGAAPATADAVFPHFIATELPLGLGGLMIAAIFAAAQSTLSTSVNSAATLLLCDGYLRYVRPDASERTRLRFLRLASLVFGLAGIATALAMMRIRSALDAWWQLAGIFSGGLLGLFLLGWLVRRAGSTQAALAVAAGVLVILWMTLSPGWTGPLAAWRSPFHGNLIIVFGTTTILAVGVALAWLSGRGVSAPHRPDSQT